MNCVNVVGFEYRASINGIFACHISSQIKQYQDMNTDINSKYRGRNDTRRGYVGKTFVLFEHNIHIRWIRNRYTIYIKKYKSCFSKTNLGRECELSYVFVIW